MAELSHPSPEPLLVVEDLTVTITSRDGARSLTAIDSVSFTLERGRTLGIIGESGCGKSSTVMSVVRLLPASARFRSGKILFAGQTLLDLSAEEMRRMRGTRLSLIMQDPMVALDPLFTVGDQLAEMLKLNFNLRGADLRARQIELLEAVNIPSAEARLSQYPHQMSGGMLQRIVTAIALSCDPELLIADEPTTALDPTAQAQILDMLAELRDSRMLSLIIVTHDIGVTARICDDVMVMYAGRVVERGPIREVFDHPAHPYTKALLRTIPRAGDPELKRLATIEGQPPDLSIPISGCSFAPRCPYAEQRCTQSPPEMSLGNNHVTRCWLVAE
jgi:oligopeptide/dipeptide ABC transporter ATP-binding protein